jgi:hypothetical protein
MNSGHAALTISTQRVEAMMMVDETMPGLGSARRQRSIDAVG